MIEWFFLFNFNSIIVFLLISELFFLFLYIFFVFFVKKSLL